MKINSYKFFRIFIKITFLSFLTLSILGKYGYIFTQQYFTRQWIWYILGILSLSLIICRKNLIDHFKRNKRDASNKTELLLTFGLFIVFANLWTLLSPPLTARDEIYFLKNNYSRFEEIARIRTFLFKNNPKIGSVEYSNSGRLFDWETKDSTGNTVAFNNNFGDQSDLATATIRSFTNDLNVHYIYLSKDTISFYFNGYNTFFLARTDHKNEGVSYIAGNYFIMKKQKE